MILFLGGQELLELLSLGFGGEGGNGTLGWVAYKGGLLGELLALLVAVSPPAAIDVHFGAQIIHVVVAILIVSVTLPRGRSERHPPCKVRGGKRCHREVLPWLLEPCCRC